MKTINSFGTKTHPQVVFMTGGKLLIKGRSIPQDARSFYQPLIDWATNLNVTKLIVDIDLEYMNSASSKKILYMLKTLDMNNHIQKLIVNWHFEEGDEENLSSGQIFEKLLSKADFNYIEHSESAE